MWMRLSHENVAAFRGINTNALSQLALVYDWGGDNIIQYMESHPTSSRLSLVWKTPITMAIAANY